VFRYTYAKTQQDGKGLLCLVPWIQAFPTARLAGLSPHWAWAQFAAWPILMVNATAGAVMPAAMTPVILGAASIAVIAVCKIQTYIGLAERSGSNVYVCGFDLGCSLVAAADFGGCSC